MKKLILFCLLVISGPSFVFAGGVTIGNGGDASEPRELSLSEIEQLIQKSKSVLIALVNTLDLQAADTNKKTSVPSYYKSSLVEMISEAHLRVGPNQICLHTDGTERDASATLVPVPQVCVNTTRLQKKINSGDAFVRIGGLLAHEFSHLIGTTEIEADDFQSRMEAQLIQISLDQWEKFKFITDGNRDLLAFLYSAALPNDVEAQDWKTSCEDTNLADQSFRNLLPSLGLFSLYRAKQYPKLTVNFLRHKLVQNYVCDKAGIPLDEMDSVALELILENNSSAEGLSLLGIIYDIPHAPLSISKIINDENLKQTLLFMKEIL